MSEPIVSIGFDKPESNEPKPDPRCLDLLPPVFRSCVDPDAILYGLGAPAVIRGLAYCTDGSIAVRVPVNEVTAAAIDAARNGSRFPRAESVFLSEHGWSSEPTPVPEIVRQHCRWCEGTGKALRIECPRCEGTGINDQGDDCVRCRGHGTIRRKDGFPCPDCGATGLDPCTPIPVGPLHLAANYLEIIRAAGGVLYLPADGSPAGVPVRFAVPGTAIEGVLMPVYVLEHSR